MLREGEFIRQVRALLKIPVHGVDEKTKAEILSRLSENLRTPETLAQPEVDFVPFITGRRPTDEAKWPGLGSSDHVALILDAQHGEQNQAFLLFRLENLESLDAAELERLTVQLTLSFTGPWGEDEPQPLPCWNRRILALKVFESSGEPGVPKLTEASLRDAEQKSFVVPLSPVGEFLPGEQWSWESLGESLRRGATGAEDPFTFGHLFIQQIVAEIVLLRDGLAISAAEQTFDVCDGRRFGSLYQRVLEGVVKPDTANQAASNAAPSLSFTHHPWFPVLLIGSDKAELYTRALIDDIVHKKRNLTDPRWLLRVGLYLELLTCIGIFEAVRDELGDLLTPAERQVWETSAQYAPIREAINVKGWKDVWALRKIVMPQIGSPRAGQVSALNLLAKKKATLAFLEVHHEDLKHAIRLAGANDHNSQETWHRVFRDAERAVLRKTPSAFPELASFSPATQEFILWHQRGRIRGLSLPTVSSWFGDQDGLYASACNQYRASMNHVSSWARSQGLMDHTGAECIPETVSLLKAFMDGKQVRLGQLQRRDGYAGSIDVIADLPPAFQISREQIMEMLRAVPMLAVLTDHELDSLADAIRPIELGPVERIIVQGREGSSLFIVAEGELEVLVRHDDGTDLPVATLDPGSVFGEMSLLTGERRAATVRSVDAAVVYEIGRQQLAPLLQARPETIDRLAEIMEPRLRVTASARKDYEQQKAGVKTFRDRIRSFILAT